MLHTEQYETRHRGAEDEPSLLFGRVGRLGPSMLGWDNCKGTLQLGMAVLLGQNIVEKLAKLMGDVAAAMYVCGRSMKEVFAGKKAFGKVDAVAGHAVMV